jgi:hypothetical protein
MAYVEARNQKPRFTMSLIPERASCGFDRKGLEERRREEVGGTKTTAG